MPDYTESIAGLELTFRTDASSERVAKAISLVEERYNVLSKSSRSLSKEKILTFVALSLADDLLDSHQRLEEMETQLNRLMAKIDAENNERF